MWFLAEEFRKFFVLPLILNRNYVCGVKLYRHITATSLNEDGDLLGFIRNGLYGASVAIEQTTLDGDLVSNADCETGRLLFFDIEVFNLFIGKGCGF